MKCSSVKKKIPPQKSTNVAKCYPVKILKSSAFKSKMCLLMDNNKSIYRTAHESQITEDTPCLENVIVSLELSPLISLGREFFLHHAHPQATV